MKLDDTFDIIDTSTNEIMAYILTKKYMGVSKKTGKPKKKIAKFYYGTMEQALVGFVRHSMECPETTEELREHILSIKELITSLKADIIAESRYIKCCTPGPGSRR